MTHTSTTRRPDVLSPLARLVLLTLLVLAGEVGLLPAAETLSISFKTTAPGGGYKPKNILAVWVETNAGSFVKTIGDWSGERRVNLVQWRGVAGTSDTDAVMGATRVNHNTTLTVTWNMLPRGGSTAVADGTYAVRFENVDDNGGSPNHRTSISFVKNGTPASGTIASQNGFTNISWSYSGRAAPVPVISSAATATGQVGATFQYQISASNTPTSYAATGLPTGLSVNASSGLISGTPVAAGTSTVTLAASNAGGTGTASLALSITPPPPVITSSLSAGGNVGSTLSYQISASNSPTSYAASGLPAGLSINTANGLISGTPTTAGTTTSTITASNSGGSGSGSLVFTIAPAKPVISSALSASGTVGTSFSYQISASNSPTSYAASGLPTGLSLNTSSGLISGTPTVSGSFPIALTATNAGGSGSATLNLAVSAGAGIPAITSALQASGIRGNAFRYQITASSSPTSYAASGLPAGLTVNTASGLISGTPTAAGTFTVALTASNGTGAGQATLSLVVAPPAPVISSAASASGTVGSPFSYQIAASNSPTSYAASGLPSGLVANAVSGLISGTPVSSGSVTVTLIASNAGGSGSGTVVITIAPAAVAPTITSPSTASGTVSSAFTYQITASGSPTAFVAVGLPTGLTVDAASGLISGTPTVSGNVLVTLSATNGVGSGSAFLDLTVTEAVVVVVDPAGDSPPAEPGGCGVGSVYAVMLMGGLLLLRRRRR